MKILGIFTAVMLVVVPAFAGVVEDSGVKGGIVVQVGCKDGESLAGLLVNEKFLVHGLDVDAKIVEHTRNDDYWGDRGDRGDGSGKNTLGLILMETREALRSE